MNDILDVVGEGKMEAEVVLSYEGYTENILMRGDSKEEIETIFFEETIPSIQENTGIVCVDKNFVYTDEGISYRSKKLKISLIYK